MSTQEAQSEQIAGLLAYSMMRDLSYSYARGFDRFDRPLMMKIFFDDAIINSSLYAGLASDYFDVALEYHAEQESSHNMIISNFLCERDGDEAHSETYWTLASKIRATGKQRLLGGRFIDRWERRDERWGVVLRKSYLEWGGFLGEMPFPVPKAGVAPASQRLGSPARDFSDPSYERPLTFDINLLSQ